MISSQKGHRTALPNHRKRDKVVKRSVEFGLGTDRKSSGFGYIVIPNDVERDEYIRYVYKSGSCMIVTDFNEVIKGVRIPKHLMSELIFPQDPSQYGQLISWVNTPVINQVTLYGILIAPDEVYVQNEYTKERGYSENGKSFSEVVSLSKDIPNYILTLRNEIDNEGELTIATSSDDGTNYLKLKLDGTMESYADVSNSMKAYETVIIETGTEADENKSTLTVKNDGTFEYIDFNGNYIKIEEGKMTLESPEILHGEGAAEPSVLGDTLVNLLSSILDGIVALTVPTAMGPSGVPVNAATFTSIKAQLDTMKSQKNKVE